MDLKKLFEKMTGLKAGIIGDLMLDTYWWGKVDRVSPEAPVPVVSLERKEYRIGGAGNVAVNIASLGAKASVLSVTGKDAEATTLRQLMEDAGIDTSYCLEKESRITTSKTRIISRNQHMLRLDHEISDDLAGEAEQELLTAIKDYIEKEQPDLLIFEDYDKGVITPNIIKAVVRLAKTKNYITAVDPKRRHFFDYKGVDIFKPNLKEVMEGLNLIDLPIDPEELTQVHHRLQEKLAHRASFITLSDKGVFYMENRTAGLLPSHLRHIADVSGAGDTVIAVAGLVYAATRDIALAADIANIAGGLVCEEVGTVAINKTRLMQECVALEVMGPG